MLQLRMSETGAMKTNVRTCTDKEFEITCNETTSHPLCVTLKEIQELLSFLVECRTSRFLPYYLISGQVFIPSHHIVVRKKKLTGNKNNYTQKTCCRFQALI